MWIGVTFGAEFAFFAIVFGNLYWAVSWPFIGAALCVGAVRFTRWASRAGVEDDPS